MIHNNIPGIYILNGNITRPVFHDYIYITFLPVSLWQLQKFTLQNIKYASHANKVASIGEWNFVIIYCIVLQFLGSQL
jgi:hypothetical protein